MGHKEYFHCQAVRVKLNRLWDKLAITLICLIGFSMSENFAAPVAALLTAGIVSTAVQLLTGKKIAAIILGLEALTCGFIPLFFCALPLMLYDALWEKKWWLVLPAMTVLSRMDSLTVSQCMISVAGIIVSVIVYMRVSKLEETVGKLISLRDEITEKNIQLTKQNFRLAQAQDNEIHLATLKERNRIAREIHDNVGHMLTRSLLQAGALLIVNHDERTAGKFEKYAGQCHDQYP